MEVIVVKYNPNWILDFELESKELNKRIGTIINNIYHIGSTAVPDLMAKPIIDIMLDVRDLDELDNQAYKLEEIGYEGFGENGIIGRRYFSKGGYNRTHQIHAFKSGGPGLIRHLAFRDYLIEHKKVAKEYGELKFDIAQRCNNDIEMYCDEKDSFVKYYEAIALEWYKNKI